METATPDRNVYETRWDILQDEGGTVMPKIISDEDIKAMSDAIDCMERSGITAYDSAYNVMYIWRGIVGEEDKKDA